MSDKTIKIRPLISVLIIALLVAIDQISKVIAYNTLAVNGNASTIKNAVFSFYYVENTGISFSMLNSKMTLIIIITTIILICLLYVLVKTPKTLYYIPFSITLSVIVAGAIGNLYDRIFRGYVIDFIMLEFINFPVFNFADICVCIGLLVLVILIFFRYKDKDFEFIFKFKGK
ncbi:MAG: signal peptidase II [Lachnospiraceae bacterium]|nr:signal peptidase II [Lachnospiraceae bacterium]